MVLLKFGFVKQLPGWTCGINYGQKTTNVVELKYRQQLMQNTKATEYDSRSDEEICEAEDLVEEDTSDLGNQQITRHVHFLVGMTSRFGRPERANSRFVY